MVSEAGPGPASPRANPQGLPPHQRVRPGTRTPGPRAKRGGGRPFPQASHCPSACSWPHVGRRSGAVGEALTILPSTDF